jgi:hypothetical protein
VPVIAPFELSLGFRDVMIGYVVLGLNQWLGEFLGVVLCCIVLYCSRAELVRMLSCFKFTV